MICLQKPFCETNRIQAIGTWNNHFNFGNYFIVSTARDVTHIDPNCPLVELPIPDLLRQSSRPDLMRLLVALY
jgi:hypothetical protein